MADVTNLSIEMSASADGAVASLEEVTEELLKNAKAVKSVTTAVKGMGLGRMGKQLDVIATKASAFANLESVKSKMGELAAYFGSVGGNGIAESLLKSIDLLGGEKTLALAEKEAQERKAIDEENANERKAIDAEEKRERKAAIRRMAKEAAASEKAYTQIVREEADKRKNATDAEARARSIGAKALEKAQKEASRAAVKAANYDRNEAAKAEKEAQREAERAAAASEKQKKSAIKSLTELSGKFDAPFKKIKGFIKAIGRIALYRAIRTAIKAITSAIKEGMTNLEAYSREVGTAFAPAVDNLRNHVLWLKNAFATALRPVIEALIPIIQRLVDWLVKAADFMAQVFSVMTGKVDANGRYTKAVLADLQKSNKQAKELRRTLLGFDEINRLDGDTGSGESNNSGLMFTQADVSDKAVQTAAKLQEIFGKIRDFVNGVDWEKVIAVILSLAALKKIVQIVAAVKKVWDFLKGIAAVLGGSGGILALVAAVIIAFGLWGDTIGEWIDNAKKKVNEFFNKIKSFYGKSGLIASIVSFIQDAITLVMDFISSIAKMIYKFVHGDFHGAFEELLNIGKILLKGAVGFILGILNIILGGVEEVVNNIIAGLRWLWNNAFVPLINNSATTFKKAWVWINNALIDIRIAIATVLKWILDRVNDALQWILDSINAAIASFNEVFGTDLKPIEFQIDTTFLDEKIDELEKKKLPPITETVQVVSEWKDPGKLKLQIDTQAAYAAIDNLGKKVNKLGSAVASTVSALGAAEGNRSRINIQKYASGGFPTMGTMFIAGERGAEYVGDIGGRTGVMNTEQMERALYRAMVSALTVMPRDGGDIYLDGEVIYRNVVRRNNNMVRSTGRTALLT